MSLGELVLTARARYIDGNISLTKEMMHFPHLSIPRDTRLMVEGIPLISTAALGDTISMGLVTDPGFACFVNMDADNFIEIGSIVGGVFVPDFYLDPNDGSGVPFWFGNLDGGKVWKARADTSAAYMQYTITQRNP